MKTFPIKYIGDNAVIIRSEENKKSKSSAKEGMSPFVFFFKWVWFLSVIVLFLFYIVFDVFRIYDYVMGNYDTQVMIAENYEYGRHEGTSSVTVSGHIGEEKVYFTKYDDEIRTLHELYPQLHKLYKGITYEDDETDADDDEITDAANETTYEINVVKFKHSRQVLLADDNSFPGWKTELLLISLYIILSVIIMKIVGLKKFLGLTRVDNPSDVEENKRDEE